MTEITIDKLRQAAKNVWVQLKRTGDKACVYWPKSGGYETYKGYSYDIPKEEQIRSAFYRELDCDLTPFELEWNLYDGLPRPKPVGEIDLVGFRSNDDKPGPLALLEIKRIWDLDGWNPKFRGYLRVGEMWSVLFR